MDNKKKLPECELEIMMIIWSASKIPVTSDYIMEKLDKTWSKTTVLNFLTRLCDRGFLSCEKDGRHNVYSPLVKKSDYRRKESKNFLKKLYNNSVTKLVATLVQSGDVSDDDLAELEKFIKETKQK